MTTSGSRIERAHETPFVHQFSIFLPNRVGQLNELLELLSEAEVEVAAISVVDSTDWAVVRMIFTEADRARIKLADAGVTFTECEALAVVLFEPDTFGLVCKALVATELNIHFAYPLLTRYDEYPVIAFHSDDHILAAQVLIKRGFTLLDHEDV